MIQKLLSLTLFIGISTISLCQVTDPEKHLRTQTTDSTEGWKKGGIITLNVANTQLTNWAAGGESSLAMNGLFSMYANYKKDNTVWDNSLDIGYGKQRQGEKEKPFVKTDDKIDILSKYGRKAYKDLYYAGLLNFKTQMDEGRKYLTDTTYDVISKLLAPAYLTGAIGMDYKPNSYFSLFTAPITSRITIVNDQILADAGAFGVTAATYDTLGNKLTNGELNRKEFGGYIRIIYSKNDWKQELLKNVSVTTKIDLFSNYLENPERIDVSWESQIAFKVNKYITVNFNSHLLYDDNIKIALDTNKDGIIDKNSPKVQFKQIIAIGFSYKF